MAKKSKSVSCKNVSHKVAYGILAASVLVILVVAFLLNSFVQTLSLYSDLLDKSSESSLANVTKIVPFVDGGAKLIEERGDKAFAEFRKMGKWRSGDMYLFVYDLDGKTLVLPPTLDVEGTNRWNTKDSNGVYYVREMIEALKNKDSGWIKYDYPKPGENSSSPKLSYFKKVKLGSGYVLVGSGAYLE